MIIPPYLYLIFLADNEDFQPVATDLAQNNENLKIPLMERSFIIQL